MDNETMLTLTCCWKGSAKGRTPHSSAVGLHKNSIRERQSTLMRIFVILLIFIISGCTTLDHDHHKKKNSLSKAIETGNTGGNKRGHTHDNGDKWVLLEILSNIGKHPPDNNELKIANASNGGNDKSGIFSFEVSRSINVGKQMDDISRFSLIGGRRGEYFSFSANIAITDYEFKKDWRYFDELENPWAIEAGVALQCYFTKRQNFIQPYIKTGYAYGEMYWGYTNSIHDSETGADITGDSSRYSRLIGAFGIDFKINDSFDLSVDIQKDYTIYSDTTGKGFDDDIMSDFGSTMYGARLIWHF
jgi:hypothetical protein